MIGLTSSLSAIFACSRQRALQQLLCFGMKQPAAALTSSSIQHLTRRIQSAATLQSTRKQNFTSQAVVEQTEHATYEAKERRIVTANSAQQRCQLEINWQHGEVTAYPFVWLRDNCRCPLCYNHTARSRCQLVSDLPLDAYPIHTKVNSQQVRITWSDKHESVFDANWLYQHSFSKGAKKQRSLWHERPAKLWGSAMGKHLKVMDFTEVMQDNRRLYDWIVALEEDGIVLLRNVSQQPRPIHTLAKRVGVLRWTHYGSTCVVVSKINPSNVAFTEGALNSHTDLAFYNYVPGVQMMNCIKQTMSEGGANQYVDGFQVATQLRQQRPDLFRILCDTELTFYDVGSELYKFHTISRHRTIGLNSQGEIESVVFSNHSRDSYCNLPLEDVPTFYEALKKLDDLFRDPSNKFEYKMRDNEMMTFNNYRVLHARSPYAVDTIGHRTLETGYVDWDEMRSRRRVLMEELGIADLCV